MPDNTPTRQLLLDAALALVAEDGVQAVTHRRVEERAGAARGSTRYHFGSRDQLLAALVDHLAERDHQHVRNALAAQPAPDGPRTVAAAAGEVVAALLADRDGALARFELYLYAARRPHLRAVVAAWNETFVDVIVGSTAGDGPGRDEAAVLTAALDGLALHALASPDAARDALAPAWFAALATR